MAAQKPQILRINAQQMRAFAGEVYDAAVALGAMQIDAALRGGALACPGTDLESGLRRYAGEQHTVVHEIADHLDHTSHTIVAAVEAFGRIEAGFSATVPTFPQRTT